MPTSIVTPNMNLISPVPGQQPGPDYAQNQYDSFTIIDQHDHSAGNGVPITPAGLNINASLPFNGYLAISLKGAQLQSQSIAPFSSNGLYNNNGNLHYIDNAGNDIPITAAGAVAGTPGSISNLVAPAQANYDVVGGTFIFQSNSSTVIPGYIDSAAITLRNFSAAAYGVTVNPPNALGANYAITLPALPASTKILTMNNAGQMSANYDTDNSTIEISSNNLQVKDLGISTAKIAASAVTTAKIADGAVTIAKNAARTITVVTGADATITQNSVLSLATSTFTSTGKPFRIDGLIGSAASANSSSKMRIILSYKVNSGAYVDVSTVDSGDINTPGPVIAGSIWAIATAGASGDTITVKLSGQEIGNVGDIDITGPKIVAYEIV